jgi:hypothetical protein
MGSCANGGGYYHYSYSVVRGCDRTLLHKLNYHSGVLTAVYRYRSRRHLRTRLPSDGRGLVVWHVAAATEDASQSQGCSLVGIILLAVPSP